MSLSITDLSKHFGSTRAVNNISISLPKGQVLGLLGRNGAGKTTTIKMMLGLLQPNSGTIEWDGKPLSKKTLSIGYLPEERGLYPKTKIYQQLRYFGTLEGMNKSSIDSAIDYWLDRFQIPEHKHKLAGELSKGNQQKIQIIATLLHDPELIILDEPFSGLDPVNATMLSDVIEEQIKKGKTVILSSHRMEQIETFCENVCMMKQGEIVVSGKLREVKENYGYKNLHIQSDESLTEVLSSLGHLFTDKHPSYILQVSNETEGLSILNSLREKNVSIRNFSLLEPTLHEIFVERVK